MRLSLHFVIPLLVALAAFAYLAARLADWIAGEFTPRIATASFPKPRSSIPATPASARPGRSSRSV